MDYHDFVIKDGKFIGKFEEMYQKCDDPWEQTNDVVQSYQKMAACSSISRINPKKVLEVGCGLGCYTGFLAKMFPNVQFYGIDISETAIEKARKNFPFVNFFVGNIADSKDVYRGGYDMIIFSELLWYVLNDIDSIICNLKTNYAGKYLLINQTFYGRENQKYGKEYFTSPEEMIKYFGMECLDLVVAHRHGECAYGTHTVLKV